MFLKVSILHNSRLEHSKYLKHSNCLEHNKYLEHSKCLEHDSRGGCFNM